MFFIMNWYEYRFLNCNRVYYWYVYRVENWYGLDYRYFLQDWYFFDDRHLFDYRHFLNVVVMQCVDFVRHMDTDAEKILILYKNENVTSVVFFF